jgi:UrcA family protein
MSPTNRNYGTLASRAAIPLMTALLCTAALTTTSAIAAIPPSNVIELHYARAELSQPEAAERLYKRIQFAARSVCHEPPMGELSRYAIYKRCFAEAVDAAVANIDASTLTALHRSRTQRSAARLQSAREPSSIDGNDGSVQIVGGT